MRTLVDGMREQVAKSAPEQVRLIDQGQIVSLSTVWVPLDKTEARERALKALTAPAVKPVEAKKETKTQRI